MDGVSYIVLTRERAGAARHVSRHLATLHASARIDHEVIVVDNGGGSWDARCEGARWLSLSRNIGGAARNAGAALARHNWLVMLDDDSVPVDLGFVRRLERLSPEVAALSADIWMPGLLRRETGGLPEVFVNCGVAIRRRVFQELGGYDAAFGSHAEEYDLAARMLMAGYRVAHDPWFRVEHHRLTERDRHRDGRASGSAIRALVRNNGWLMKRYAPASVRRERLREVRARYRALAMRDGRVTEYAMGLRDWRGSITCQPRREMAPDVFDRFTGLAAARESLVSEWRSSPFGSAGVVDEGRNAWCVRRALEELGVRIVCERELQAAEVLVIGTMAPGPMLDSLERRTARGEGRRVIAPWRAVMERRRPISGEVLTGGYAQASGRMVELPRGGTGGGTADVAGERAPRLTA